MNNKIKLLFLTLFNLFLSLGQDTWKEPIAEKKLFKTNPEEFQICSSLEKTKRKTVSSESRRKNAPSLPWLGTGNRGAMLNLSGLGCVDNYPSSGVGVELGLAHINNFGITTSGYLGGSSNECLWLGASVGYTHGLTRMAPYGLIGGAFAFSGWDAVLAGTLELGANFRLTGWLSIKPALRIGLGEFYDETGLYNYNTLMISLTLDPYKLLPYWY